VAPKKKPTHTGAPALDPTTISADPFPKARYLSAHDLDRIIIRLPPGMREKLGERAVENGRSMTAEVVAALTEHLKRKDRLSALEGQLEAMQNNINRVWDQMMELAKTFEKAVEKKNPPA
jgi:plasmid stability protein